MLWTQSSRSTHTRRVTWRVAAVLWVAYNSITSGLKWSHGSSFTCRTSFAGCLLADVRMVAQMKVFVGCLLTTWFLNMTHQSGSLCSASGAGRSTGVLVGRICCVLVCLRYPSNKSFAPHLSPSMSVRESQLCVSAFSLKHFMFDTLMTLPDAFLS